MSMAAFTYVCILAALLRNERAKAIAAIVVLQHAAYWMTVSDEVYMFAMSSFDAMMILALYMLPASNFTIRMIGLSGISIACHALLYFALIPAMVYDSAIDALIATQLIAMLIPDEFHPNHIADAIRRFVVRIASSVSSHRHTKEMP